MPNQYTENALSKVTPAEILDQYYSDISTADIAEKYGVTRQRLGQYLIKNAPAEWQEAQVMRALAAKEKAEDDLAASVDALSLSRAREQLKAQQWNLEKTFRRIYGQNADLAITVTEPERDITQVARRLAFLLAKGIDAGEVVDEVVTLEHTQSIEPDTPK